MRIRFIVLNHDANVAGFHQDLRLKKPKKNKWISFAIPDSIPLKEGIRVTAIRTYDHTTKSAIRTGLFNHGYGAGTLTTFDEGICILHKNLINHIVIEFKGKKIKGIYHLIKKTHQPKFKKQYYIMFKGRLK